MFEQEAKHYSTSSKVDYVNNIAITLVQQAFKHGAELGYNKANEWHYVKDGDLPSDRHGHIVINQDWDKVTIRNGRFEHLDGYKANVIAWREIEFPNESK